MVDIAAISGAMTSLKTAHDIAKTMLGLRDVSMVREKVIELQGAILTAQSDAFEANSAQTTLLERVRELEKEVADLKAWDAESQRYQLQQVAPGAFAYTVKPDAQGAEPAHWICANCYQHRRKSILQSQGVGATGETWVCSVCKCAIRAGDAPAPAVLVI